ncbi:MAG TPA: hypothetical protein VMJ32_13765 [Pirellulales bacterium]|nr:hypothetical protein [Pirellulales bacterium]
MCSLLSDDLDRQEKSREISLRRKAGRFGYLVRRSRRQLSVDNEGGYMLVDIESNSVAAGSRFELSLDDLEAFLK